MLKQDLRGRPPQSYKDSLSSMSPEDYNKLEKACVQAYLLDQKHVILVLSHLTKLADDFPNVTTVRKEGRRVYVKVNVSKLLVWLNKKGHSSITFTDIAIAKRQVTELKEKTLAL